jgi:hypothetical protein
VRVARGPGAAATRLDFLLPGAGRLEVGIYDVTGRLLARMDGGRHAAGRRSVVWTETAHGSTVPSGVYFVRGVFEAGGRTAAVARGRVVVRR